MVYLSDIAHIIVGPIVARYKVVPSSKQTYTYKTLSLKAFGESTLYDDSYNEIFLSKQKVKDDFILQKNDVLMRLRSPNFAIFIDRDYKDTLYPSFVTSIRIKDANFYPKFIAYFLNSSKVQKSLIKETSGTRIEMIKASDVGKISIPKIPLQKQKQIIDFMDMANKEVMFLKTLIDAKSKYKKSIFDVFLQKLNKGESL